jgi:mRNA-degrading endonuclease toxin of MazEF toxin-antitoxin module
VSPTRGEVWLYERPKRKARPVLILLRSEAIEKLNRILVVPSTTEGARHIPTHVWIDEDDGMREPCALTLDETFAARRDSLTHRITVLGAEKMDAVCRALAAATSCG